MVLKSKVEYWQDPITKRMWANFGDSVRISWSPLGPPQYLCEMKCYHCDKWIKPDAAPVGVVMALISLGDANSGGHLNDETNIHSAFLKMLEAERHQTVLRAAERLQISFDEAHDEREARKVG